MMRSTSTWAPLVAVALGTLLVGCMAVGPRNHLVQPRPPVNIDVTATGCGSDHVVLAVDPWEARVRRGQVVQWPVPAEADSMRIVPKNDWPFPALPPTGTRRGTIRADTLRANTPVGRPYRYSVVLYCSGRVIDIDPILIRDPTD
jgi:hypothetical protein